MISRPIFIIGAPRSGTSILTWALGQHSNIQPLEETNWIARLGVSLGEVWKLGTCNKDFSHLGTLGWSKDYFYQKIGEKVDEIIRESLVDQIIFRYNQFCGSTDQHIKAQNGTKDKEFAFTLNDENSILKIIRSPNDPKKRWIDGTPENTFYANTLLRLFPNARFIHLLRNPDNVSLSLMNFKNVGGPATNHSYESSYRTWARYVSSAHLIEKALGKDHVCRIQYEDMVKSPEMTINVILKWLGEDYENSCIEPFAAKLNSSKASHSEIKFSKQRDNSLRLLADILHSPVGVPDPSALKKLLARHEETIKDFTANKNDSVVVVEDWGPRETLENTSFNTQPCGTSAIWVKAVKISHSSKTHILFGQETIPNSEIDFRNDLVSFYVSDKLINKSGSYEVRIIDGNSGNEINLGTFKVRPKLEIVRLHSFTEYQKHRLLMDSVYQTRRGYEASLQESMNGAFQVAGFSFPAGEEVKFLADFVYSDGKKVNWRERLVCPKTGLNNRQRAAVHIMDIELGVIPQESVYITEQVTALYKFLVAKHPRVIGSEFLGSSIPRGSFDKKGVRSEDLTKLTFENDTFGAVLSFDCLEHMPDFMTGIKEIARVLKPGGRFMWSVPFRADLEFNLQRASLDPKGIIIHHEQPEYHGDPINRDGCLCFTHFGWEMLEQVKNAGFKKAYAVAYWSDFFGYLGVEQLLFVAEK